MNYLWLIYATLSAVFASLVAIFGKIGLKNIDTNVATAIRAVVMALFLIIVILFQGKISKIGNILADKKAITFIILSGVAGAMSWLFYFLALKNGKVQQVAPIDRLSVVFAIVLAAIFLQEKVSFNTAIGVVLIAVGSIFVALG